MAIDNFTDAAAWQAEEDLETYLGTEDAANGFRDGFARCAAWVRTRLDAQEPTGDALIERIARAFYESRVAAIESDQERRSWPAWEDHEKADADEWRDSAAAVLPIVAVEVRKAKAEAWNEGAVVGARDSFSADLTPNPYRETGDSDEHR